MGATVQATLIGLANGWVTDDATNLIWLQDWDVNGSQKWSTQKAWAENLSFAGSDAWVLPSIDSTRSFSQNLAIWLRRLSSPMTGRVSQRDRAWLPGR